MQTRFCASLLLAAVLVAGAGGKVTAPSGKTVRYSHRPFRTRFEFSRDGKRPVVLSVRRDLFVSGRSDASKVEVIGEVPGQALIISDTYPSLPLGLRFCQAGEEQFLRVFTFAKGNARESAKLKLASCRQNIELAEPGVEWDAATGRLQVHWLQGPTNKGAAENRTIQVSGSN